MESSRNVPFFSVIIPAFNRAHLIGRTLESVSAQRFSDFEVIIVDDGSTDETVAVVETQARADGRIRLIAQANLGPGAARNTGITAACGRYVVFLDSDDLWFPWTLQAYRIVIEQCGHPSIVMGSALYWSREQELVQARELSPPDVQVFADYFSSAHDRFLRTACVLAVRTEAVREVGGFTTRRINGEDYDLLYRMGTAAGFVRIVDPPVVAYRQHDGSSARDAVLSFAGVSHHLDEEERGGYPGGASRQHERRSMILFGARNVSWMLLETRHLRQAGRLYCRTLRHNWAERRLRYLAGFPLIAGSAALGLYRERPKRSAQVMSNPGAVKPRGSRSRDFRKTQGLRILMTVHHRLDWDSGAAGSTLQLSRAYEVAGHQVSIFSFDNLRSAARWGDAWRQLIFPWAVARELERRADHCDVIDATTGDAWVWASLLRDRLDGATLVTRSTGLEHTSHLATLESARRGEERLSWKYPLYHGGVHLWEVKRSLRGSDLCMFLNSRDLEYAVSSLGVQRLRTMVVANGIPDFLLELPAPPIDPGPTDDRLRIAVIGSFIQRKGIAFVVPALARLLDVYPSIGVSLLGTGYPIQDVLSRFKQQHRARIAVVERYAQRELPQLLHGHQIQVFGSIDEGFGKTLIEGMACGLAVVTTDAAGPSQVVRDGRDALVVATRDSEAIVQATSRLIQDPGLRARLRRAGYDTAQRYGWARVAETRLDGYRRAIELRKSVLHT